VEHAWVSCCVQPGNSLPIGSILLNRPPFGYTSFHILLAESALDTLELVRAGGANRDLWLSQAGATTKAQLSPASLLTQARDAARLALGAAQGADDPIGAVLARLALRRATRLSRHQSGEEGSGVAAAERLVRRARRLDDPSLLGRSEVALADELLAASRFEAASAIYYRARLHFEEHHLDGLAFWPRRALQLWADEGG
jgi:hypothetical protein